MPDTPARAELRDKRSRMENEIAALEAAHDGTVRDGRYIDGPAWTDGDRLRVSNLRRGIDKIDAAVLELDAPERDARLAILAARAANPANIERAVEAPAMTQSRAITDRQRMPEQNNAWDITARNAALRTIGEHRNLDAEAADRLDEIVRRPDAAPVARYLTAIGDPAYFRAFTKVLRAADPQFVKLHMTADEEAAWDAVNLARSERGTALAIGAGGTGGYALPMDLDPTVTNTSNGTNCPLRKLARVQTLTQGTRYFVNADGVVAQYGAESSTMVEAGPTYSRPALVAARGSAQITASYEMFMDDDALVTDLVQMLADGRDTVDATKFLLGSGTNEPLGILAIGTTGALSDTQRVQTITADVVVAEDVYNVWNAIPPRYQANTQWALHPAGYSFWYRSTPSGSTTEPQLIPDFGGPMLGRPAHPWSTMAVPAATGEQTNNVVLIGGDWKRGVTIGDRLGMTVEIIPNLLAAGTIYATGQRALIGWWRSGVVVHNPNALRFLEAK